MAFDSEKFGKISQGDSESVQGLYGYHDIVTDTLATIMASGYFDDFINELNVNDIIFLQGTDDEAMVEVTSVTTNVTVSEYSMASLADGAVTNAKVNASAAIDWSKMAALTDGQLLIGSATDVATDVAVSGDIAITNAGVTTIQAGAVDKAMLASTVRPAYMVVYAGKESNGGGSATVAITEAGTLATDLVFAQVEASTNAVTVNKVTPTTDTVTVLMSGDPGASTIITYQVLRATS